MTICRGIIYHKVYDDFLNIFRSIYTHLKDEKKIKSFENDFKKFNKSKFCTSYPFARTALMSILSTSSNIKPGDEVILPAIQIKGMIDVVKSLDLKPIIVDIDHKNLNFDLVDLKKKIHKKTKVILYTYLYGIVPDLDKFYEIVKKKKIIIIEDFSQCLGGKYRNINVGNFGDYGIYSLSATKTLDTYGGGILVTNNKSNFSKNLKFKKKLNTNPRSFLFKKILLSFTRNLLSKKPFFYFVILTFKVLSLLGYENFSKFVGTRNTIVLKKIPNIWLSFFTSLQAYYGSNLIKKVSKENDKRVKNVKIIKSIINKEFFTEDLKKASNVYWQLPLISSHSKIIQKEALKSNIDIASPSIQILSKVIKNSRLKKATKIYDNLILVPSYHTLKKDEIFEIGVTIKKICQKL